MARSLRLTGAALLLAALAAAGAPEVRAQDADSNLDKALQKLEARLQVLRATPGTDPKLLQDLEEIAADLRKEKDSRAGKPAGGGGGGGGGTGTPPPMDGGILQRTRESFFRGLEGMKEEEKAVADAYLLEFLGDYRLAKDNGDEKSKPVIREHTERKISHSFASRDANRLKDNLNGIIRFWEGNWGGRGGR
jgi:hypothetical protein